MEIFQNTIWKLIFRQGSDSDRRYVIPSLGEPTFTTDTYRLYVGTGNLSGGVVAGNIFQGTHDDITTYTSSVIGDQAFSSDKNTLYRLRYTPTNQLSSWEAIGRIYSSDDSYINIVDDKISLNTLSAYSVSNDLVNGPITLESGKISLSSTIPFTSVSTKTITVSSGLRGYIGTTDVTNTPVNSLSSNLVIQSNQLYCKYYGLSTALSNVLKNITSATTLSTGHYRFVYSTLPTSNPITNVQIFGEDALGYFPRTTYISNSSCDVQILSSNGAKTNANITLLISY